MLKKMMVKLNLILKKILNNMILYHYILLLIKITHIININNLKNKNNKYIIYYNKISIKIKK